MPLLRKGLRRGRPPAEPRQGHRCLFSAPSPNSEGTLPPPTGPLRPPPRGPAPPRPAAPSLAAGSAHQQAPPPLRADVRFPPREWSARPVNHAREGRLARPALPGACAALGRGGRWEGAGAGGRRRFPSAWSAAPAGPASEPRARGGAGRVGNHCPEVKGRTPSLRPALLGSLVGRCPRPPLGAAAVAAVAAAPWAEALGWLPPVSPASPGPGQREPAAVRGRARAELEGPGRLLWVRSRAGRAVPVRAPGARSCGRCWRPRGSLPGRRCRCCWRCSVRPSARRDS